MKGDYHTREQQRARIAYEKVGEIAEGTDSGLKEGYRTLVKGIGANIQRNGLAAAVDYVKRYHHSNAADKFLDHLAQSGIPSLPNQGDQLPAATRNLSLADYMVVTRECLRTIVWYKRAVEALIPSNQGD